MAFNSFWLNIIYKWVGCVKSSVIVSQAQETVEIP